MNDHLWRLKCYLIPRITMSKNWKNSAVEEGKESTTRSKQRESLSERDITTFCSVKCEFLIFCVVFCNDDAICEGFSFCLESSGFF